MLPRHLAYEIPVSVYIHNFLLLYFLPVIILSKLITVKYVYAKIEFYFCIVDFRVGVAQFGGWSRSVASSTRIHAKFWERWAMAGRPGAFHKKHGTNIRLYEDGTVAHRVDSYNKAVVFTEQPIPIGASFQVKMLDKGGGWAGSIVSSVRVSYVAS